MSEERVPVLVIGGSLVGLCTALFLRHHGVDVMLVERHPSTSLHPRTPGYNARTMELFRQVGIEQAVRTVGTWELTDSGLLWAESLASADYHWIDPPGLSEARRDFTRVSPSALAVLAQDELEPVLRENAEAHGAELRFGTELVSFSTDAVGVEAVLEQRETSRQYTVSADYLVAADGADSPVRHSLGIDRDGPGVLEYVAGITARAAVGPLIADRNFVICQVENHHVSGMLRVVRDLVSLNVRYDPARGESIEQFTEQRCVELVRAAAGVPDLAVQPVSVQAWQPTAAVARRFSYGRVFLCGDAAHVMPPSGAFGANTGIQDGWNLAWKLAFVLNGWAADTVLDSYSTERRPVAELTVRQALSRARTWFDPTHPDEPELVDDVHVVFGYCYPPRSGFEDPRHPAARSGTRLPHSWLERAGQRLSTIDLGCSGLVLLAGCDGQQWSASAAEVGSRVGVPIVPLRIGSARDQMGDGDLVDPGGRWLELSGLTRRGAMLVRPDGFIAWKVPAIPERSDDALENAVHALLRPAAVHGA